MLAGALPAAGNDFLYGFCAIFGLGFLSQAGLDPKELSLISRQHHGEEGNY